MGFQKEFRPSYRKGTQSHVTVESTGTNLKPYGMSIIFSTAAAKTHRLSAPTRAGLEKWIFCRKATTTNTAVVLLTAGHSIHGTSNSTAATQRKLTFNNGNRAIGLISLSTSKWHILSNVNTVTIGTS